MKNILFVLTQEDEDGTSVIGVYETRLKAEEERNAIIRDYWDISEDEVPDAFLEDEVSDSVTYDIVARELQ
jgi:hypothetical protein